MRRAITLRYSNTDRITELRQLGGLDSPAHRSSTPVQNPYSDPALLESDADKSFSQSTLLQTAQKKRQNNDTVIAQREQEINDIAKGIIELADIFRELQTMVIDQGTMLDRIDYNVERMTTDVKAAEKELVVVCAQSDPTTGFLCETDLVYRPRIIKGGQQNARYYCCCCYSLSDYS